MSTDQPATRTLRGSGRRLRATIRAGIAVLLLLTAAGAALWNRQAQAQSQTRSPGEIVRVFGLGGVMTADGTLWQYRPDKKQWLTIDEAFRAQGKETKILPLPVRPDQVREMATWGFLVTDLGVCWLYDLDQNRWEEIAPPGK